MRKTRILGISITEITETAPEIQRILTMYGCSIRTRLGLNNNSDDETSNTGSLILLELYGNEDEWQNLENALCKVNGIEINKMDFSR